MKFQSFTIDKLNLLWQYRTWENNIWCTEKFIDTIYCVKVE